MVDLRIGTSGYSYDDWVGPFYPPDLQRADWLSYYANVFDTVEVNFTYYKMPSSHTMQAMARKVPSDFLFSIKAHSSMTHDRTAGEHEFARFREAIAPLVAEGKLGAVLAQFPWSFKPTAEAAEWLRFLARNLSDLPVAVEFRNRVWIRDDIFDLLRELGLGFCCVDQPRLRGLTPPVAVATSPIAYVRFHGRNAEKWWQHDEAWERYDYLYARDELAPWVEKIRRLAEQAERVFAYFNNHYQAQSVQNAQMFQQLLIDAGLM